MDNLSQIYAELLDGVYDTTAPPGNSPFPSLLRNRLSLSIECS
jgi:hypothetical protein